MKQPGRDYYLISHINAHYAELKKAYAEIQTVNSFSNSGSTRKAILFDYFQIGELLNHLSDSFAISFGEDELYKAVSIRNRIVHGYDTIDDEKVFLSIKNDLPSFIDRLNEIALMRYKSAIDNLVGTKVKVLEDVQSGKYYTSKITTLLGRFQPVIINDASSFFDGNEGIVVDVVRGDLEDTLVIRL